MAETPTAGTPAGQASKELVMTWFAVGIASAAGLAMLTDDFVWRAPESTKHLFGCGDGVLRRSDLGELDLLNQALYKDADTTAEATNFHFIIAEDDTVVLEFDITRTLHDGGNYHNQYCMVVHVRGDKIAEVREHTDTLYSDNVIMGTPEKNAAFTQRLNTLRSAHTHRDNLKNGIHRERPGAADLAAATDGPAVALGDDVWMSPGVSNAYAVATDDGRVIINAGMIFEGPLHARAFADVPGPTRTIIVTQGHADHWGGINTLRDNGTDVVMHRNYRYWRDDNARLLNYRAPKSAFAFAKFTNAIAGYLKNIDPTTIDFSFPEPTVTFDTTYDTEIGGRRFELTWTPGGETTDSLVVWLPEDRTLFTGNLFGPLFGHVPNLVTIRGDRYRDPIQYLESLDVVLAHAPDKLITGHFDPIVGADRITEEVTAMREAMQAVHDRTIELMNAGEDVYTAMRKVTVPGHLDVGEGYGKTSWNVRAIWELYTGWFHHRSTTELYGAAPDSIAADVVQAAGAEPLIAAGRTHLDVGRPVEALQLTDLVLAAQPGHAGARALAVEAHEAMLAHTENFWDRAWLTKSINELVSAQ